MLGAGDATHAAFEAWRRASPEHAAAYEKVSAAHDRAQALADEAPLLALRHATLARTMLTREPRTKSRAMATGAALLFLAGAPLAAFSIHNWVQPKVTQAETETFRTDVGQQADVTLSDGSTVTLDTASRIEVRFTGDERRVLLDGQGWFRVKPSAKPFLITAGGRSFIAQAGSFDVRSDPGQVRAFASDGDLSLANGESSVTLKPRHLLDARGDDVVIRALDDPTSFTGWRTGLLQFDDVPLAEAAGELNRYRRLPIRLADPHTANLRVSGTFHTAETPAFVDALTSRFSVRVKQDNAKGIILASR